MQLELGPLLIHVILVPAKQKPCQTLSKKGCVEEQVVCLPCTCIVWHSRSHLILPLFDEMFILNLPEV